MTSTQNVGMPTALSNCVDVALLMVIAWLINFVKWNYVYYLNFLKGRCDTEFISLLVVLAARTQSAQIPSS
jgi:hypothetical protein